MKVARTVTMRLALWVYVFCFILPHQAYADCSEYLATFVLNAKANNQVQGEKAASLIRKINSFETTIIKKDYFENLSVGEIRKVIDKNDELIELVAEHLKHLEIDFIVEKKQVYLSEESYLNYDAIRLTPNRKGGVYTDRLLKRLARNSNVENVDFDFIDTFFVQGALGIYYPFTRNVGLTGESLELLLLNSRDLDSIIRHEFMHAFFERMRTVDKKQSIYHMEWHSLSDSKLTPTAFYEYYMSAEEIYTFTNEYFWQLPRSMENSSVDEHFQLLKDYSDNALDIIDVVNQGNELANKNIDYLKKTMESEELTFFSFSHSEEWAEQPAYIIEGYARVLTYSDHAEEFVYLRNQLEEIEEVNDISIRGKKELYSADISAEQKNEASRLLDRLLMLQKQIAQKEIDKNSKLSKVCKYFIENEKVIQEKLAKYGEVLERVAELEAPSEEELAQLAEAYKQLRLAARAHVEYSREKTKKFKFL